MSSPLKYKGISYSDTKLVLEEFPNPFLLVKDVIIVIIVLITLEIFLGINVPFFLTISVIDEFIMMPTALNYSKLNCSRIDSHVTCSLTGSSLFGSLEKAIDSKHQNLIEGTKKYVEILSTKDSSVYRNDLLVLATKNEKIYIYTAPDLLEGQIYKLNDFLQDKKQSKIYIQTNKSSFLIFYAYLVTHPLDISLLHWHMRL
ncbi:MAG: hypothetical protein DCF19_17510 [Pseudanabaena frigida]|uniref:Uncharacterized protein n=1 Tax=Pseudanabaena frigida TaxID=945775 RepID=A0A2W4W187_9CYAN|nr:MAG: hypothetical protein DCF19_17510 [Pseudanabaena frigida]